MKKNQSPKKGSGKKAVNDAELSDAMGKQQSKPKGVRNSEKKELAFARCDMRRTSQLLLETLADAFPPKTVKKMLGEMASATIVTKGGNARPDYRTRLDALRMIYSYTVGNPVQRQEQVNYNLDMNDLSESELIDTLAKSPAMRKKIKSMLEDADQMAR